MTPRRVQSRRTAVTMRGALGKRREQKAQRRGKRPRAKRVETTERVQGSLSPGRNL